MGLDMYLQRKKYVKNWDHNPKEKFFSGIAFVGGEPIDLNKINTITFDVHYWRKANWIHRWFVENVQDGNDDCGEYYTDRGQLRSLCKTIDGIIKEYNFFMPHKMTSEQLDKIQKLAEKELPGTEGFFFGSQDYDEYYFETLKETKEAIENSLKKTPEDEYYYSSSW